MITYMTHENNLSIGVFIDGGYYAKINEGSQDSCGSAYMGSRQYGIDLPIPERRSLLTFRYEQRNCCRRFSAYDSYKVIRRYKNCGFRGTGAAVLYV